MPGAYTNPKAFNRRFFLNIGTADVPVWAELAKGISSRSSSFTENSNKYYDMAGRGTAETDPGTQEITRNFSGWRVIGDQAQDYIFETVIFDLDRRQLEYYEFYDNYPAGKANGWKGLGTVTISDDGSGDATARENVGFALSVDGKPERGTVTIGSDGAPVFVKEATP